MGTQVRFDSRFEKIFQTVPQRGIVVLDSIHSFPIYNEDFYLPYMCILINTRGIARIRYDNQNLTFHPNEVAVIGTKHLLHALDQNPDYTATVIVISDELSLSARVSAYRHDYQKYHDTPCSIHTEDQVKQLIEVTRVMNTVSSQELALEHRTEACVSLLHVFFELLTTFRADQERSHPASRGTLMFNEFMDLVASNYMIHHDVQFYAKQMHMTPKYLSKIISDATGKGAFAWISEYIINKAITLLRTRPDLTIHKIGMMVGFDEQPSFTRFFKRYAKASPRDYRDNQNYIPQNISVMERRGIVE